jgi:hypothetical protein
MLLLLIVLLMTQLLVAHMCCSVNEDGGKVNVSKVKDGQIGRGDFHSGVCKTYHDD